MEIFDIDIGLEDVVNGENQVACESRYCPFNEGQLILFSQQ